MKDIRIGISGWTYPPWRGVFYPAGLPHGQELEYASRQVNSIEINGTFYGLQRPSSFRTWREATPEDIRRALRVMVGACLGLAGLVAAIALLLS